jgi:hypothetical protein
LGNVYPSASPPANFFYAGLPETHVKINNFLQNEVTELPKKTASLRSKSKDNYSFSVDSYLDKAMNIPRQIYGVAILELPPLKSSAKSHSTKPNNPIF